MIKNVQMILYAKTITVMSLNVEMTMIAIKGKLVQHLEDVK